MYAQVHNAGKMTVTIFLLHTIQTRYIYVRTTSSIHTYSVCRTTHQDYISDYHRRDYESGSDDPGRKLHHDVVIFHMLAALIIRGLEQAYDGGTPMLKVTENEQWWKRRVLDSHRQP